jgi:acetyl-CoA C-acetyltransferase
MANLKDSDVVIVDAVRTPIGSYLGPLSALSAQKLGSIAIRALLERTGLAPAAVDEVIFGNVISAGLGQNPGRQVALGAGLPDSIVAWTLNFVCGSGLKAVMEGANAIRAGEAGVVVAGGTESMSNAPYLAPGARVGYRMGDAKLVDAMIKDGLWEVYNDFHMGNTAECVAEKYKVTRADQDAFALESHRRAIAAADAGRFKAELVPVSVPQRKGDPVVVSADDIPRRDTSPEKLAKLAPVFKKDGTVTAGNASSLSDGASAVLLASAAAAKKLGLVPLARITGQAGAGIDPKWIMMAPELAVKKLLEKTGAKIADFDLVEVNEAFSSAAVALTRVLELDPTRTNVNGGAVALGHPIGCTGARLLTTLVHALKDRGGRKGLATLCIGGGNAVAVSVEMI